ncbi:hypothetical protein RclHR1_02280015 [Rhizophagus clarus]|uniref:Uncharacterized protein n=1 Tax=Rhizophagus clarus TaxID=94130 RepID=A0A2Z6QZI8_9GLOM|nr:hypothetical protein RclHR1_02280015 [Rhizophagus clarus]GES75734.1 hypothetical protein GLOIN_2v1606651 [Rhizophagus clarus]
MNSKTFTIFTILFVLFATSIRAYKYIRVTSPGKGPWKKNSGQVVSWDCLDCSPDEDVVVRIIQIKRFPYLEVFRKDAKNARSGQLNFIIGKDWDEKKQYFAEVALKNDPDHHSGDSVKFGIEN